MTVAELIARASKRLLDEDPQLLGVRVCPVALAPGDVEPLRKALVSQLGAKTYVALSVPGASTIEEDHLFVSPDKSAAEKATLWRNTVDTADGEHIVYASVQVHGKAGGLKDCLTPLREDDLRAEFVEWCDQKSSGTPTGLGAALRDSGILGRASSSALCEFATAVLRDRRENKWESCGHHLPLLNLARDMGLRSSTAAARLEENERAVSRASTGERSAGITAGPLAQLREAFRAEAGDVRDRLKRIDLTEYLSGSPARKKAQQRERKVLKAVKQAAKKRASKRAPRPAKPQEDPTEALVDAVFSGGKDPLAQVERRAKKFGAEVGGLVPAGRGQGGASTSDAGDELDPVWSRAQQLSEFGTLADRVPLGLGAMLLHSLRGEGYGLRWVARESASALLDDLPPQAVPLEIHPEVKDPDLRAALALVVERRRAASTLLLADSDRGLRALSTLIGAPLVALADRKVRAAMIDLLRAYADLYTRAAQSSDGAGRQVALSLDTVEVRARSGDAVLIIGPLHPLWLSQALGRFDALLSQEDLSPTAKRLLVRSLSEAPVAPDNWPCDGFDPLQLGRPIGGLICFQSAADRLEPKEVAETAARVVELFLSSLPHAQFGLRVAILGGEAGPVVDGIAAVLDAHPEFGKAEVHHRGLGQGGDSDKTDRVVTSGRLILGSLPATGDPLGTGLHPHLVFHLAPASSPGVALQPTSPSQPGLGASSGLLPTEFTVVESGLRARTPIDSSRFPALAAFESLHALASGAQPQGAFIRNAWAVSLRELLADAKGPSVSWDVVLAPRIGRRPPEHRFLLSHERPTNQLSAAIVSREIAPAARALKDAFRALGVEDLRPLVLNNLAIHLASVTNQGVISPRRTGEQVLAASVLGMALARELSGGEAFVAHFDGASAATLLGQDPSVLPGAFAVGFGAQGDRLRIVVGYAALKEHVTADIARGQLEGALQESVGKVLSSIELATAQDGVGAVAAREALNWLLWPALAAAERPGSRTEQLLLQLDRGVPCELSAVAYLPSSATVLKRGREAKSGKHLVQLRSLDVGTFEALVFGGSASPRGR